MLLLLMVMVARVALIATKWPEAPRQCWVNHPILSLINIRPV